MLFLPLRAWSQPGSRSTTTATTAAAATTTSAAAAATTTTTTTTTTTASAVASGSQPWSRSPSPQLRGGHSEAVRAGGQKRLSGNPLWEASLLGTFDILTGSLSSRSLSGKLLLGTFDILTGSHSSGSLSGSLSGSVS